MKIRTAAFATLCAVLLLLGAIAVAQMPLQFSADMVMTPGGKHGGEPMTGKYYFGGNKIRMEMNAAGQQVISIIDVDRNVMDQLMPQQKMYMEMDMNKMPMGKQRMPDVKQYDASNPCAADKDVTCNKLGSEMVNGRMCDKWEFTPKAGTQGVARTVWIDKSSHIPIKTLMADGTLIEFRNLKEGPQAASLFQIPAGYQKMDMSNMMRGMRPPSGDEN